MFNVKMFGWFFIFFVKDFNLLKFFQVNSEQFVFVKGIFSDYKEMGWGLF